MTACVGFTNLCAANVDAVALGAPCNPNGGTQGDCTDANAICPSTGTAECECKTGYTEFSGVCGECTLRSEMVETTL